VNLTYLMRDSGRISRTTTMEKRENPSCRGNDFGGGIRTEGFLQGGGGFNGKDDPEKVFLDVHVSRKRSDQGRGGKKKRGGGTKSQIKNGRNSEEQESQFGGGGALREGDFDCLYTRPSKKRV